MKNKTALLPGITLTVVFMLSVFLIPARHAGANGVYNCECIDQSDIKQKIEEIEAAIKAYQSEMRNLLAKKYTPEAREALNKKVQEAINQAMKGRRSLRSGGHVNNNCDMKVDGPTSCLKQATGFHEEVHQQACLKTKTPEKIIESILSGKDRFERDNAAMSDYAEEEIAGYSAALRYLKEQLARLREKCK